MNAAELHSTKGRYRKQDYLRRRIYNMRNKLMVGVCLILISLLMGADSDIRLNSVGFLPNYKKEATIVKKADKIIIVDYSDERIVYRGELQGPEKQKDVGQKIWTANFTDLNTPGEYYLKVPGVGNSVTFKIGNDVFDPVYRTVFRGFYLWRCGTAVEGEYQGSHYAHDKCHMNDAFMDYIGEKGEIRDGTGGWHDAGDYGKYIVNAGITVANLFLAWDHFGDRFNDMNFSLPQSESEFPEFLREIKWETDWMLKMSYPDESGRVSHKLTRTSFSPIIMPEEDDAKRYFTEWSSTATADFAAVMAMAARYFGPYDQGYAQKCLQAAKNSYDYLKQHPGYKGWKQGDFSTGAYSSKDRDDRLWAAAEMWETTGDEKYLKDFENQVQEKFPLSRYDDKDLAGSKVDKVWDWSSVRNLGVFTYALSVRKGRNPRLLNQIKKDIITVADKIVEDAENDIYDRPLGDEYYWGCNGTIARQVINLQVANMISGDEKYMDTALDAISHILGRNYYNRSYVTGIGINPPKAPHSRRSMADDIEDPWPGYLVGGGHSAKGWKDEAESYQTNEIAINWQAALVYALSGFVSE